MNGSKRTLGESVVGGMFDPYTSFACCLKSETNSFFACQGGSPFRFTLFIDPTRASWEYVSAAATAGERGPRSEQCGSLKVHFDVLECYWNYSMKIFGVRFKPCPSERDPCYDLVTLRHHITTRESRMLIHLFGYRAERLDRSTISSLKKARSLSSMTHELRCSQGRRRSVLGCAEVAADARRISAAWKPISMRSARQFYRFMFDSNFLVQVQPQELINLLPMGSADSTYKS